MHYCACLDARVDIRLRCAEPDGFVSTLWEVDVLFGFLCGSVSKQASARSRVPMFRRHKNEALQERAPRNNVPRAGLDDTYDVLTYDLTSSSDQESFSPSSSQKTQQESRSSSSLLQLPLRGSKQSSYDQSKKERSRERRADPLGLTVLHEPDGPPRADIVFVHGLGGGSRQSWSRNRDPALFWPLEWLPFEAVIASARISTFGYDTHFASHSAKNNILNISDFAKSLLYGLRFATGAGERLLDIGGAPLIFVAHSMGGLVVKKAIILGQNDPNYTDIIRSVSATVFLSTPHRGTDYAETLNHLLSACVFAFSPKQYIAELRSNSATLLELNEQFRNLAPSIEVVSFFETQATTIGGVAKVLILQKDSSTLGYPREISNPLDADHQTVSRYSSKQDPNYISVRDILRYLVAKQRPQNDFQEEPDAEEELLNLSKAMNDPGVPVDDQEFFADKRLTGSCKWIMEEPQVSSFLEEHTPLPRVLWLFGKPGSGKSVMASYLINVLHEQELNRAFYFFRFGDQVKNNLTSFLLSLAWQLALQLPEYRRRLVRLFDDGLNVGKSAPRLIWQKLIVGALLKTSLESPLFIVVDALDETESAPLLLKLFMDLTTSRLPLRLILISRKNENLSGAFEKLSKVVKVDSVLIDNADRDLRMYVEEEMDAMRGDAQFKKTTTARVLSKADGNFLWAHLVVNEILQCHTEDDVEEALNHVPEDLEPLYERMDDTLAKNMKPAEQALSRAVLRWATCARYPLTLAELKDALQPDHPRVLDLERTIHSVCGEFVAVDKRSHLTMIHSSARDFLMTNSDLNFYVCPPETHQALFTKCVLTLIAPASRNRVDLARGSGQVHWSSPHESGGAQHQESSKSKSDPEPRSFLLYAATSWPYHLEASANWADQKSLLLLANFFRSHHLLQWMYFLSQSSRLRVLVQASKTIADFLKASDKLDSDRSPLTHRLKEKAVLSDWANDLIRIVGKFGSQLTSHPRTIFNLVPAFCPTNSIMHRQFAQRSSYVAPKIFGLSNSEWDDCLAKFAVPGSSMPLMITTLNRYFSVLTADGTLKLYHSATCEEARSFRHGERVLAMAFSAAGDRMATYGFLKTKVWDVPTARHLFSIPNPPRAKALTIAFANNDDTILICSDDRIVRSCHVSEWQYGWELVENVFDTGSSDESQYTSPQKACFNADCSLIAIAYRGHALMVWSLTEPSPWPVGRCEGHRDRSTAGQQVRGKVLGAHALCWNPMTGHVLGISNEGYIFKWHPTEMDYSTSITRATNIKCSADGRYFVTSSSNGMLRVWDFEHFTPIYKLSYATSIQDFAIDRNDVRIYDIRDRFCNVWEPNAIMRLLNSDDKASDTNSTHDSSLHTILPSEASIDASEPVTTLALCPDSGLYAMGNDDGRISIFDVAGKELNDLSERFKTIEHLCWSRDGTSIASMDLSRSLMVEQLLPENGNWIVSTLLLITEPDVVSQILLNADGTRLLVSTGGTVKIYSIEIQEVVQSMPDSHSRRWTNHPINNSLILGFSRDNIRMCRWDDCLHSKQRPLDSFGDWDFDVEPQYDFTRRRRSEVYPMSPDEVVSLVTKVLFSTDGRAALLEVLDFTPQGKRRKQHILVDVQSISDLHTETVTAFRIPSDLQMVLEVPLGFLQPDGTQFIGRRRSSAQPNHPGSSMSHDEHVMAFIDKEFWVCTSTISDNRPGRIRKHFPLPRDWLNMEWLELATTTKDGNILCPRNGEVAIISDGFKEEWHD